MGFELPFGITGFGVDHPDAAIEARRQEFVSWARAVASSLDSSLAELAPSNSDRSFDAVHLERLGLWLLHNAYAPLVGVVGVEPEPGESWAVAGTYVDLEVGDHVAGWGPELLPAKALNAPLEGSLVGLGRSAQEQADRYKPETIGNVIFNYWRAGN